MSQAKRIVTLPPGIVGSHAVEFAADVRRRGAEYLELRTDLQPVGSVPVQELAATIPLVIAERSLAPDPSWLAAAALVDRELGSRGDAQIRSHHAPQPLLPEDALELWRKADATADTRIKHVEPLGPIDSAARLFETQRLLCDHFGPDRVTVLATGPLALPFRAALSEQNAFDYLAATPRWQAANGQRLLEDAVRSGRTVRPRARLGILGTGITGSRSPRIHEQPFDRIDLPEDAPVGALVDALRPFYRGFAVTSPFKQALAEHTRSSLRAINTLIRSDRGWDSANTDLEGARAVLRRLGDDLIFLGDGGASAALQLAAAELGTRFTVVRYADAARELSGTAVWTWPDRVQPPEGLTFAGGARVAVIAYGLPAMAICRAIVGRGGTPLRLGAAWFVAQARAQREKWKRGEGGT